MHHSIFYEYKHKQMMLPPAVNFLYSLTVQINKCRNNGFSQMVLSQATRLLRWGHA